MTDLVARLREAHDDWGNYSGVHLWAEAADEIERSRARVAEAETLLTDVYSNSSDDYLKKEISQFLVRVAADRENAGQ